MKNICLALISVLLLAAPVRAQLTQIENSEDPLVITADESLEWLRNQKQFLARTNAKAVQGDASLAASLLTANYRESEKSNIDIWEIIATENVVLSSKENYAYGDLANYNLDKGLATLTGQNLRMTAPDQEVTARDRFEYWTEEGKLIAFGNAMVKRKKPEGGYDILEGDKIIAVLKENARGERVLETLESIGNVKITTPTEIVTGNYGIYRAGPNKAELDGNIVIRRGPNILEGDKAEVDLNTNTSRIYGGPTNNGRVRGVFYPGSEDTQTP